MSDYNIANLKRKIDTSKFKLLQNKFCFFGILALYFKYDVKEDVETAYTDGKNIVFGAKFLDNLSIGELNWVIAHEVMHVANGHLRRRGMRRPKLWNVACDYAIHSILKEFEDDLFKMPKNVLYDKKYDNKASETIYKELYDEFGEEIEKQEKKINDLIKKMLDNHDAWEQAQKSGSDSKDGSKDSEEGFGDIDEASPEEWEKRMVGAAKLAAGKNAGHLSGFLKKILGKLTPPKKDWRLLLQEFITPEIFDYSFNPPDRRFSESECMLPDFNDVNDAVKNIVFFIDISGSMSEKVIYEVYSEVVGAVSQFSSMSGYLGYFDTEVQNFKRFEDVSEVLENKPHSGGGTEFEACFEYLNNTDELDINDVAGIVLLTDGYCGYGKSELLSQGIPTMFVMTESDIPEAPFGRTIYLKDNEND